MPDESHPGTDRSERRRDRHAGARRRPRRLRPQRPTHGRVHALGRGAAAAARQDAQVPVDRAAPDRGRRGRPVLPEGRRGRGAGPRRRARRAGQQRGRRRARSCGGWPRWPPRRPSACASTRRSRSTRASQAAVEFGVDAGRAGRDRVGMGRCGVAPGAAGARSRPAHRAGARPRIPRPAGLSGQRAAPAHRAGARARDRRGGRGGAPDRRGAGAGRPALHLRQRRRHRHLPPRDRQRPVERAPGRLLRLHGHRVRADRRSRRRPLHRVRAQPVRAGDRDERAGGGPRRRRRGVEVVQRRARRALGARPRRRRGRRRVRRARQAAARPAGRPDAPRRQGDADSRPLRSDRQPARLVRRQSGAAGSRRCGRSPRAARAAERRSRRRRRHEFEREESHGRATAHRCAGIPPPAAAGQDLDRADQEPHQPARPRARVFAGRGRGLRRDRRRSARGAAR